MYIASLTFVTIMYISFSATLSEGRCKTFLDPGGGQKKRVALLTCNCHLILQMERLVWINTVENIFICEFKDIYVMIMSDYFTLATYQFTYKNLPAPKCDTQLPCGLSRARAWIVMALSWHFITVMSAVTMMNNEGSMITWYVETTMLYFQHKLHVNTSLGVG